MTREEVLEARIAQLELRLLAEGENREQAWQALRMIRQAIEEIGPVGVLPSREQTQADFISEAESLVSGIKKLAG